MLLLANLTLTAQSQFANTPNTFALFGNPKSDKEPKKDCLFATNRVTDVDIDANFKPFKLPFTEGVIADGWRLKVKINQSKRAWCKSHALNLFI